MFIVTVCYGEVPSDSRAMFMCDGVVHYIRRPCSLFITYSKFGIALLTGTSHHSVAINMALLPEGTSHHTL